MLALIVLGAVVIVTFIIIFAVHLSKVNEEKRIQLERKLQEFDAQAKRFEPLLTRLSPHLLSYELRSALAKRWLALLRLQQDAGDSNPKFLAHLAEAEKITAQIQANSEVKSRPITDKNKGQEAMNLLKNLQFLLMKEYREGRLSEAKGQEFVNQVRLAASQIVVDINQAQALEHRNAGKYRAALVCFQNILTELKKYRGADKEHFAKVLAESEKSIDALRVLAKQEAAQAPNMLAAGMEQLEKEEAEENAFKSDIQKAIEEGKARARQQG